MKKNVICLVAMSIMVICTFSAGCISNDVNAADVINDAEGIIDTISDNNEAQDELDKYLKIIENPPSDYTIEKHPVKSINWVKKHVSVVVHDNEEYIGYGSDVTENSVEYVENGVSFNLATYFIKSDAESSNYCVTVARVLKENANPHILMYIYYLTPADYDKLIVDLYNHI